MVASPPLHLRIIPPELFYKMYYQYANIESITRCRERACVQTRWEILSGGFVVGRMLFLNLNVERNRYAHAVGGDVAVTYLLIDLLTHYLLQVWQTSN